MNNLCLPLVFIVVLLSILNLTTASSIEAKTSTICSHESKAINATETLIDSPVVDIFYTKSNIVYARSRSGTVYRSTNTGKTWENYMSKLTDSEPIKKIYETAKKDQLYLLGFQDIFWTKSAKDDVITKRLAPEYPVQFFPHPTKADTTLLITAHAGCFGVGGACFFNLHISNDFGKTFTKLRGNVLSCSWGKDSNIFYIATKTFRSDMSYFAYSLHEWNLYKVASTGIIELEVPHSPGFLYFNDWLFIVTTEQASNDLHLFVSQDDGKTIKAVDFPEVLHQSHYHILSTSKLETFIAVSREQELQMADVFASDSLMDAFTLALPRARRSRLHIDFYKSLEGIYIANQYDEQATFVGAVDKDNFVNTLVSTNSATDWKPLGSAQNSTCTTKNCHLHLYGSDYKGHFYTDPDTPGVILASGNEGKFLNKDQFNTASVYMSRDAGIEWTKIKEGVHEFIFGDHAGILVLVPDGYTTNLTYSWSEGLHWTECAFTDAQVEVNGMLSFSSKSQKFVIHGTRIAGQREVGVITQLDFSGLHERKCEGLESPADPKSDYETWYLTNGNEQCVLGEKMGFVRRKRDRECFNPEKHQKTVVTEYCPCTKEDYQCAGGCYSRNMKEECINICKGQLFDPELPPSKCKSTYSVPSPYVLIPGTKCNSIDGFSYEIPLLKCPKKQKPETPAKTEPPKTQEPEKTVEHVTPKSAIVQLVPSPATILVRKSTIKQKSADENSSTNTTSLTTVMLFVVVGAVTIIVVIAILIVAAFLVAKRSSLLGSSTVDADSL